MPGTRSQLGLGERRAKAFERFLMGWTNTEVAKELDISEDTVARYRAMYEEQIKAQADANPQLLQNYLENSVRILQENDLIRQEAWRRYEAAGSDQARAQFMNVALKAQGDRIKLFGLLGVKAEFFAHVQHVRLMQERLLQFMSRELCAEDRAKLAAYISADEMEDFVAQSSKMPVLDAASVTVS